MDQEEPVAADHAPTGELRHEPGLVPQAGLVCFHDFTLAVSRA